VPRLSTELRLRHLCSGIRLGKDHEIKLTGVFVYDQSEALEFYAKIPGFVKKVRLSYRKIQIVNSRFLEELNGPQLVREPKCSVNRLLDTETHLAIMNMPGRARRGPS